MGVKTKGPYTYSEEEWAEVDEWFEKLRSETGGSTSEKELLLAMARARAQRDGKSPKGLK